MNYYLKIDTTKIDESRLFKGQKGTYLDCVMIESKNSQYGDSHMIVQSVSKEEREAGVKGPIIGNAKEQAARSQQAAAPTNNPPAKQDDDETVPF